MLSTVHNVMTGGSAARLATARSLTGGPPILTAEEWYNKRLEKLAANAARDRAKREATKEKELNALRLVAINKKWSSVHATNEFENRKEAAEALILLSKSV